MTRRIKLTTEWVEWRAQEGYGDSCQRLYGARDYVATVRGNKTTWTCDLFPNPQYTDDWRYYDQRDLFIEQALTFTSEVAAMDYCEQSLVDAGLIDPIWWAARCLAE